MLPFNALLLVPCCLLPLSALLPFAVQYTVCCRSIHSLLPFNTLFCRSMHYLLQMNELLSALLYVLVNEPVQFPAVAHIASCFSCFLNS